MDLLEKVRSSVSKVDPRILDTVERLAMKLPFVQQQIDKETGGVVEHLEKSLKPYKHQLTTYSELPQHGRAREDILREIRTLQEKEAARWKDGFVSGSVYHGQTDHVAFLNEVYGLTSQCNPLHADLWPSMAKYEAEIVSMTAQLLGGKQVSSVCGTVSSGGTESILLAMKTYRDQARQERGIKKPELVLPVSAHAAFDKAGQFFGIKLVRIDVDAEGKAKVSDAKKALSRNTVALVGSAPSFPYGVIDPISELAALAKSRGVGFHTDACLGGFVLPFAEKLGAPVPGFDFRVPGVTSMSADTHKYGYAAKGTSVVLYRTPELRRYQYYTITDWPGGLYSSPTIAGSRPGGLSAACWATLVSIGETGYLEATQKLLETTRKLREGVRAMPQLRLVGDGLFILAFDSKSLDIYRVLDFMSHRQWTLNGLQKPPALHLAVTLPHTQEGVAERFLSDLREAVAHIEANPQEKGGMAPVYGMANAMPFKGLIGDFLRQYMDVVYKV